MPPMLQVSVPCDCTGEPSLWSLTCRLSCPAGPMRITPLLQHRMLLFAFKEQPNVRVSLSISAPLFKTALSPGDLGQLDFIQVGWPVRVKMEGGRWIHYVCCRRGAPLDSKQSQGGGGDGCVALSSLVAVWL